MGDTVPKPKVLTGEKSNYLRYFEKSRAAKCAVVCFTTAIDAWPKLSNAVRQLIINVLNVENQLTKSY